MSNLVNQWVSLWLLRMIWMKGYLHEQKWLKDRASQKVSLAWVTAHRNKICSTVQSLQHSTGWRVFFPGQPVGQNLLEIVLLLSASSGHLGFSESLLGILAAIRVTLRVFIVYSLREGPSESSCLLSVRKSFPACRVECLNYRGNCCITPTFNQPDVITLCLTLLMHLLRIWPERLYARGRSQKGKKI